MMIKRMAFILLLIMSFLVVTGCWDRVELNDRAFIIATGIDKDQDSGKMVTTLQVIVPEKIDTATKKGGGENAAVQIVSAKGSTVYETLQYIKFELMKKPYFQHNRILVIGEQAAKEGVTPYLNFFMRTREGPERSVILVSKGNASEILRWQSDVKKIPADYIESLVHGKDIFSVTSTENIHEFMVKISGKTTSPYTSGIEIRKNEESGKEEVKVTETAAFKKDKLVGWLNLEESKGMQWINNEFGTGIIETGYPEMNNKNIILKMIKSHTELKPKLKDGKMIMTLEVKGEGNIEELKGNVAVNSQKVIGNLEKNISTEVKNEIENCLKQAQKTLKTDIFGFGEAIHSKYPKEWKKIEGHWDDYFPEMDVEVNVKIKIRNTGMLIEPI
ncbi:hypothetical protein AWH48_13425 [Domibacillus aminovorans]|uniref:Uncharacterized protein n=1 Tax=Domibacillus aminovorans TaxID=29332 RepID=A0A177KHE3_9BACI|nr:Ger(x)C family spore germination protein [Domibacillus aminovorans]OAH52808.1 hypothetical protein AWH48_13425 [Domibacillus aminovorans]